MTSTLRTVYHITAFSWYAFIVKSLADKDGEQLPPGIFVYGGPWKYLTFLNLLLQMSFFGLAAVNDLQTEAKSENTVTRCKDLLFSVFAFPVGMFVVLLFWTIFAYDRELVYPATIDAFFPPWMNHAMHTFVLPVLLGEVLVEPHDYPQMKHALAALGFVGLSYLSLRLDVLYMKTKLEAQQENVPSVVWTSPVWQRLFKMQRIVWVYLAVGLWVYPLLGHFSTTGLVGFFFFNMSVVILLYVLGDKLNNHFWSKQQGRASTKRAKANSSSLPHKNGQTAA